MRISKSHLTSFALGSLVTGIVCYFLLSWTTNPQAAMPVVSKTPGSPASATPTSASTPGSPFAPSDIRTSAFQDQTALWIPAEVINLMFDESVNYHDLTIQPTWRAKLQLSQAQAQAVERILRQQVIKLGQVEAKTSTVVEITEQVRLDPKNQSSRAYTVSPEREFVKLRYPFLK